MLASKAGEELRQLTTQLVWFPLFLLAALHIIHVESKVDAVSPMYGRKVSYHYIMRATDRIHTHTHGYQPAFYTQLCGALERGYVRIMITIIIVPSSFPFVFY